MFQPSPTQCLSPTRDKSPSIIQNVQVYDCKLKKTHIRTWLFFLNLSAMSLRLIKFGKMNIQKHIVFTNEREQV